MKINRYQLIYPEPRTVTAEQINSGYSDAVANGDVEYVDDLTTTEKAEALENAGLITLASP
jgi:hypothetical protein